MIEKLNIECVNLQRIEEGYYGRFVAEPLERGFGVTLGNALRREFNNEGILAKRLLAKIKTKKAALDGVRNLVELAELRKANSFYLIAIDAPQKLRFERMQKRKRKGDPAAFEDFKKIDDAENKGISKGQEINACIAEADFKISNTGTIDELHKKLEKILAKLGPG